LSLSQICFAPGILDEASAPKYSTPNLPESWAKRDIDKNEKRNRKSIVCLMSILYFLLYV